MSKEIYTDGGYTNSCSRGIGAWAFIILDIKNDKYTKIDSGSNFQYDTTNNKMELIAGIEAFKALEKLNIDPSEEIELFSDSMYFVRGINEWVEKWKKSDWKTVAGGEVKNQDLWIKLEKYKNKYSNLKFNWVKGHDSNTFNIECDSMVQEKIRIAKEELSK